MTKKVRVPNYDIFVEDHETLVINTPTFQRLFRIYQLGLAYMVYPCATHTRGAHCIETLYYADKIIKSLKIPDQEVIDLIRMSALLHDIGHLPFTHTLEDENIVFRGKHDKKGRLDPILVNLENDIPKSNRKLLSLIEPGEARNRALKLIDQTKEVLWTISYGKKKKEEIPAGVKLLDDDKWFIADIVGNTICADLFAYIRRDVEYTGIEKTHGGYRIFDYLELCEDENHRKRLAIRLTKAGFRIDVLSAILDVLDVRYALMERVALHHAKCAASAMLARAARLLELSEDERLYKLGDEMFLEYLEEKAKGDSSILEENRKAALDIIKRLKSRIFYKRIYRVTSEERANYDRATAEKFCIQFRDSDKCTEFENEIEDQFNLPRGSIAVFCPEEDPELKEANVMVIWKNQIAYPLNSPQFKEDYPFFGERIEDIENRYKALWVFYVFIEPDEFGSIASLQKVLHDRLKVKCDPLLIPYLEGKDEYQKSKQFSEKAGETSVDIESKALKALLAEEYYPHKGSSWLEAVDRALDAAKIESTEKKNKNP